MDEGKIGQIMDSYMEGVKRVKTSSGIPLKELYIPEDLQGMEYTRDLGYAGEYPFTRGIHANMYRGKLWTRRQGWGYGTPEESNQQLKFLVEQGNTGLAIYRDLPCCNGIDPDHPMAEGQVGVAGVSLCSLEDMEILTEGIPLDKVSISLLPGASWYGAVMLAQYIAVAEKRGISLASLRGQVATDTLLGYTLFYKELTGIELPFKINMDIIEYCTRNMPLWNATYIGSCYNMREAGLNAPQEIAFGLAVAIAYIQGALQRGLNIDDLGPRVTFYCSAGIDLFEEVAKLRAARRMWARIMRERFGATNPHSWRFRFAVQTAGSSLVPQQALNNIVRIAYEALVGVLGGAQSVFCCTFDEPICLPTEVAQEIALRTQQILAYETGVASVADPLGGSYFIEWLTNRIEEEATKILHEIENLGGMVKAIETGWVNSQIEQGALQHQKELERGERIIVGMNAFTTTVQEAMPGGVLRVSPETAQHQIARVQRLRESRDYYKVSQALTQLKEKARLGENLMPPIVEAVKAYTTVEEIMGTIREAYGYSWDPWGVRSSPFTSQ